MTQKCTEKRVKAFNLGAFLSHKDTEVDAINLHLTDGKGEGVFYEFTIYLLQFSQGEYAMQAEVFSDAWIAFIECSEVFELLADMDKCLVGTSGTDGPALFDKLVSKLEMSGWTNEGRKQGRFFRRCNSCGTEVRGGKA